MTHKELIAEFKKEFTYVPDFDIAHVQLDETISRDIQSGIIYHTLTNYGKLEFANMHIELPLLTKIHPLSNRFVIGVNDETLPQYNPELPAADFIAYSVTETFLGDKIIEYWIVTALFEQAPLIVNEIFNRSKWLSYRIERITNAERKTMLL